MFPLLSMREEKRGLGLREKLFVRHGVTEDEVAGVGRARTWRKMRDDGNQEVKTVMESEGEADVEGRREVGVLSRLWRYVDGGVA